MQKFATLICLAVICFTSFGQTTGPKIEFDNTSHNFGEILVGAKDVTHDFIFTNTGDEPLMITNAKATCGCTVPKWTKTPVMPGETGTVSVTYTSTRSATANPFGKTVTITTNGTPERVGLTIKGHVVKELSKFSEGVIDNSIIDLGEFKNNKTYDKSLIIRNAGTIDLNILSVDIDNDHVTANIPNGPIAPNEAAEIILKINTKGLAEKHEEIEINVTVKTDSGKTPENKAVIKGIRK
ncbi:DUF1573 domain-containing protein [Bacteroidales bacterium OttesenSCG-928-K03]|nr:DUF1573 domain-containing protein [Odoribacter sp. OttesenSCG-928-L07]MDL2239729.1 DUF1573 domain-containing protein [Bacteroidales bacterium OttesenSCG-928-L14]MDL2242953.1 DUF1573 domain-containing protein [Bacteroidales bacterium OttesenSCG-928-K03]